jgi:hypothetical protein
MNINSSTLMKTLFCLVGTLLRTGCAAVGLFSLAPTEIFAAETFSRFGTIRANIAQYVSGHRWLVCYESKHGIEGGEVVRAEAVGFDNEGNIFRIRGYLRPGAENMLSLESYDKPSVSFSTKEGYFYIWNATDGGNPFEYCMNAEEYEKLIGKFELFPLWGLSKDAPLKFELLKENPEVYDRALALPRPKSVWHLENPTARRLRVGIFFAGQPNNNQSLVKDVVKNSAAAAAGIKPEDVIVSAAINGTKVEMGRSFPIPDDKSIRILTFKVMRKSNNDKVLFSDVNIFLPSSLEHFLIR